MGLTPPPHHPTAVDDVDSDQVRFWTSFADQSRWGLPRVVRLLRGQTESNPRPNKDLFEVNVPVEPAIAAIVHQWNSIAQQGVHPEWITGSPPRQSTRPRNHAGIQRWSVQIRRQLRAGQLDGRYLVVEAKLADVWPEIFISPLGVVDKAGSTSGAIRLINDYSIPLGHSVNDITRRDNFPSISYNPPRDIAKRIFSLATSHVGERILMMLGDVSGAFRHIPIHADSVHMFAFIFDGLLVIDLSCGFGWCGSPAFYSLAGSIINTLYEHGNAMNRQFTGNVWCDDHTCLEIEIGTKCVDANLSLRRDMATVLGPTAINEQKFTTWSTKGKALGLQWNTEDATVSIPSEKLLKASERVKNLLVAGRSSRTTTLKAIGSLRHVVSCFPPARAFIQCLQETASNCPRYGQHTISMSTIQDLRWFQAVLQNSDRFNSIPCDEVAPNF